MKRCWPWAHLWQTLTTHKCGGRYGLSHLVIEQECERCGRRRFRYL